MIRSMTGFASSSKILTINNQKVPLTFNIKSLNARYFDFNCKVPYPLSNLETEFMRLFKSLLYRGSIIFSIHIANPAAFKGAIEPSLGTIKNYLDALGKIKETYQLEGSLSLANILTLPNIFIAEELDFDEQIKQEIFEITKKTISQLIAVQEKEGQALLQDMSARMRIINQEIESIEKAFVKVIEHQKEKVNEALVQLEADESKFGQAQKDALFAILDKIDIHEEIIRFKNHIKSLESALYSPDIEKGRRIDFIIQELSREINTITAKCSDGTISSLAINVKVELEKIREQAQNIV